MIYRFLTSLFFLESIDWRVNTILRDCIKSGIGRSYSITHYTACVEFNNGVKYEYWNANRYYSWLNDGEFTFNDGSEYKYKGARPSAKVMYQFKKALGRVEI